VHLREPDDVGDLRLGLLLVEAEVDDLTLASGKTAHQRVDHLCVLDVDE
jgi:hypothetical protein